MSETEPIPNQTPSAATSGPVLCPYCGNASSNRKECDRCRGVFEPLSRQASQNAMGPWYIRDEGNPFRPGCSYATIKALVSRKRIDGETVLRGPSSRQFWLRARNTPGVAHLLGECHACHKPASPTAAMCTNCGASFEVEDDRQFLGLAEVRALPTPGAAAKPVKAAKTVIEAVEQPPPIVEVTAATPEPNPEPGSERSYEPVRHPSRGARAASSMSDEQIEEMLRKGRAYDRANSSTRVVTILIALAIVGVVIAVGFAVVMAVQNLGAAPAATAGGTGAPTDATPVGGR